MTHLPFSVFKKQDRRFYSVRFKNEQTGQYLPAISTKKESEAEAIQVAFEWLKNGIPYQRNVFPYKKFTLRDMVKDFELDNNDAQFILFRRSSVS